MIKADGSMLRPVLVNGEIVPMTRMGHTDVARQAFNEIGYSQYEKAFRSYLNDNLTPIYEFVSPNNKIVLEYDRPKLILLAVRDNFTGEYLPIHSKEIGTDLSFASGVHVQEHIKTVTEKRWLYSHRLRLQFARYFQRYHSSGVPWHYVQ